MSSTPLFRARPPSCAHRPPRPSPPSPCRPGPMSSPLEPALGAHRRRGASDAASRPPDGHRAERLLRGSARPSRSAGRRTNHRRDAVAAAHRTGTGAMLPAQRAGNRTQSSRAVAPQRRTPCRCAIGDVPPSVCCPERANDLPAQPTVTGPTPRRVTCHGVPAVVTWSQRQTLALERADQFPGPPPALSSEPGRVLNEAS